MTGSLPWGPLAVGDRCAGGQVLWGLGSAGRPWPAPRSTAAVRDAFAAWDEGDAAGFETVYAEDVAHPSHDIDGVEELQEILDTWLDAFPDLAHEVDAMIAEGDWVATRFRITGTHEGEFQGIDPTGEAIEIHGMAMKRVEHGRIVERHLVEDLLDVSLELGAVEHTTR